MRFPERLTILQQKNKLEKKDVFQSIGMSRAAYYRYVNGEREPSASTLIKLADYFGVSTDYLLGRTDNPNVLRN